MKKYQSSKFEETQKKTHITKAKIEIDKKLKVKNGNQIIKTQKIQLAINKYSHLFLSIFIEIIFQIIAHTAEYNNTKAALDASFEKLSTLYSTAF